MKCKSCQAEIPADAAFCPNCGQATSPAAPVGKPQGPPSAARTFSGLETLASGKAGRAASTQTLTPGKLFADRYLVDRKIGEGGMGVVYVAKDNNTNEEIVLKLIHPGLVAGEEAMKRLVAEGVTARQIRHPGIVAVYDVGQTDGQPYLTMEYVKGGTLRSWMVNAISSVHEIGVKTAVGIVRSILAGLAEAHRMGIVHRDLSPENILLCGDPALGDFRLKILDFGIAKAVHGSTPGKSGGSGSVGKPLYMAPEQITAPDTVGPSADLYSVTVMLYELLMEAVPQGRWETPSESRADVPKALDKVIERGLMARARSRFQSAQEYGDALDAALAVTTAPPPPKDEPAPRPPPPTPPPAPPVKQRKWGLIIAGSVAALLVLGVIGNLVDRPNRSTSFNHIPAADDDLPDIPETRVAPPPTAWNASGPWYDDLGKIYSVQHDGSRFTASGFDNNGTPVRLVGDLSQKRFVFNVLNGTSGQAMSRGDGFLLDNRHLSFTIYALNGATLYKGCFHLNHTPSPPCVNGRF
jgi:serine/threonine protein kinase